MMHNKKCLAVTIAAIIGIAGTMEAQAVIIAPGMYQMTIDVTPTITRTTAYGGTQVLPDVGSQASGWNSSFTWMRNTAGGLPSNELSTGLANSGGTVPWPGPDVVLYGQPYITGVAYGSSDASDGVAGRIDFNVDTAGIIAITSYNVDFLDEYPEVQTLGELSQWAGDVSLMSGLTTASEFSLNLLSRLGLYEGPSGPVLFDLSGAFTTGTSCNSIGCLTGTGVVAVPSTPNYTATLVSARTLSGGSVFEVWSSQTTITYLGEVSTVPVPAAVWLFGSGLLGLIGIARRKKPALGACLQR